MAPRLFKARRETAWAVVLVIVPGLVAFLYGFHQVRSSETDSDGVAGLTVQSPLIDLGTVWSGSSASATFILHNATLSDIRVDSVQPDCGCTVSGVSQGTIGAGKDFNVPVSFFPPEPPDGRGDDFLRAISVHVSAPSGQVC
jgi:hypothetical protein